VYHSGDVFIGQENENRCCLRPDEAADNNLTGIAFSLTPSPRLSPCPIPDGATRRPATEGHGLRVVVAAMAMALPALGLARGCSAPLGGSAVRRRGGGGCGVGANLWHAHGTQARGRGGAPLERRRLGLAWQILHATVSAPDTHSEPSCLEVNRIRGRSLLELWRPMTWQATRARPSSEVLRRGG